MIFYLRNNRVIARFKRIDNAPGGTDRDQPGEKLQRDRETSHGKRELQRSAGRG